MESDGCDESGRLEYLIETVVAMLRLQLVSKGFKHEDVSEFILSKENVRLRRPDEFDAEESKKLRDEKISSEMSKSFAAMRFMAQKGKKKS